MWALFHDKNDEQFAIQVDHVELCTNGRTQLWRGDADLGSLNILEIMDVKPIDGTTCLSPNTPKENELLVDLYWNNEEYWAGIAAEQNQESLEKS